MTRRLQIAVIGGGKCSRPIARAAAAVGAALARRGAVLVCGGLGGVMGAAASGAKRAGGLTIGVLPTYDLSAAHPAIAVALATGMGHARNVIVAASGDAVIALSGEHGTASEIALALKLGRPVVVLNAWEHVAGVRVARTPAEAVEVAIQLARPRARASGRRRRER